MRNHALIGTKVDQYSSALSVCSSANQTLHNAHTHQGNDVEDAEVLEAREQHKQLQDGPPDDLQLALGALLIDRVPVTRGRHHLYVYHGCM